MAVSKKPLTESEYEEFLALTEMTKAQRGDKGHQRYQELRYRYILHLGKK